MLVKKNTILHYNDKLAYSYKFHGIKYLTNIFV